MSKALNESHNLRGVAYMYAKPKMYVHGIQMVPTGGMLIWYNFCNDNSHSVSILYRSHYCLMCFVHVTYLYLDR